MPTKRQKEKIAEIKSKMIALQENRDLEMAHSEADALLCELLSVIGLEDIALEYIKIDKWYA